MEGNVMSWFSWLCVTGEVKSFEVLPVHTRVVTNNSHPLQSPKSPSLMFSTCQMAVTTPTRRRCKMEDLQQTANATIPSWIDPSSFHFHHLISEKVHQAQSTIIMRILVVLCLTLVVSAPVCHGWTTPRLSGAAKSSLGSVTAQSKRSSAVVLQATNSSWFFAKDHRHHHRQDSSSLTSATSTSLAATSTSPLPDSAGLCNSNDLLDNYSHSPPPMWGQPLSQGTKDFNKNLIRHLKGMLFDQLFAGNTVQRAYARFYALETIARMPYFSYLSVLHLFETLGLWRRANYLKIHFAESWNEMHHLLIMEELGGHDKLADRWVAQHVAFGYYWFVIALYLYNPTHAYHLNQMVEEEAYETYDKFITQHQDYLQQQPAPHAAVTYYKGDDMTLFDVMHHQVVQDPISAPRRRPRCDNLLDCFVNIRDDEGEHVKTMAFFQQGAEQNEM